MQRYILYTLRTKKTDSILPKKAVFLTFVKPLCAHTTSKMG